MFASAENDERRECRVEFPHGPYPPAASMVTENTIMTRAKDVSDRQVKCLSQERGRALEQLFDGFDIWRRSVKNKIK